MRWISQNWGDAVGLFSLLLSIYALWIAGQARRAVARAFQLDDLRRQTIRLERSIVLSDSLRSSRAGLLPKGICNDLRRQVARLQHSPDLTIKERQSLKLLGQPIKNDYRARQWLSRLADTLIAIQERFAGRIREELP